jgi:hypothetical protein
MVLGRRALSAMNTITTDSGHCQADQQCHQPLRFRACLEAHGTRQPVYRTAEFCSGHLGDAVHDLTTWAHQRGLTNGHVTVLILSDIGVIWARSASRYGPETDGLPFGVIPLAT